MLLTSLSNFDDLQAAYFFDATYSDGSGTFANTVTGTGLQNDAIVLDAEPAYRSDFGTNNRSAVRLDNTVRGTMRNFQPYEGTLVLIARPNLVTPNLTISLLSANQVGTNANTTGGTLSMALFSGVSRITYAVSQTTLVVTRTGISNDTEQVYAIARDQDRFRADHTLDGTNITSQTATGDTDNGIAVAIESEVRGRFGHLNLGTDTSALASTVDIAALIFIGGNAVTDQQTEMQALYTEAQTYYGL